MAIDVRNLPSNSHASKERESTQEVTEVRAKKVVSGKTKTKKNNVRKLSDTFVSEDVNNVKEFIFKDIVVPTIKKLFVDIIRDGVEMLVYGNARGRSKYDDSPRGGHYTSYGSYYTYNDDRREPPRARTGFDYEDIGFESRVDAENVLIEMKNLIRRYGMVRVADLFDMADLSAPYTSNRYGWTDISSAHIVRRYDGDYIIKLPRAVPID